MLQLLGYTKSITRKRNGHNAGASLDFVVLALLKYGDVSERNLCSCHYSFSRL